MIPIASFNFLISEKSTESLDLQNKRLILVLGVEYCVMDNLLDGFDSPAVMDIKVRYSTFRFKDWRSLRLENELSTTIQKFIPNVPICTKKWFKSIQMHLLIVRGKLKQSQNLDIWVFEIQKAQLPDFVSISKIEFYYVYYRCEDRGRFIQRFWYAKTRQEKSSTKYINFGRVREAFAIISSCKFNLRPFIGECRLL